MKILKRTMVVLASTLPAWLAAPALSEEAQAQLIDASGNVIGTAEFTDTPAGLLIAIDARDLSPGEHAVHLHQTGECDPASAFESAGDHFAPDDASHGYLSGDAAHAGDLPNQTVDEDGALKADLLNTNVTLTSENALLDDDGAALVIHSGADDYRSQPSGNSGDPIACGVIARG